MTDRKERSAEGSPAAALLHYSIVLAGFGTVFLGPLLPALSALLHLSDRGAGGFLAAQFIGAFLGGWTTRAPIARSAVRGYTAATLGFAAVAWLASHAAPLLWWMLPVAVLGFGIGQTFTSINLLAAQKWQGRRGTALTLLNFSWSFGALTAPLLITLIAALFGLPAVLAGMAVLLAIGLCLTLLGIRGTQTIAPHVPGIQQAAGLGRSSYLYYSALLVLYGGVETCLGGWLTTYDLRYGGGTHGSAALSTTLFWTSLTMARAASAALILRMREGVLIRLGLAVATLALLSMSLAHTGTSIGVCAVLTGISLAPWFPLVLAQLLAEAPTSSQVGRIIAVSALGAAALPWLMGQVSSATGSLRVALALPIAGIALLLLLTFRPQPAIAKSV